MTFSFNPLDPMNQSMYHEFEYPGTIEEVVQYYDNAPNPNGPKLRPQPTKDSWYYRNDGKDDGHISALEKLKAFVKGGTYNMVRGLFCDENGFSIKRTLTSAAVGTAIALTGPIGVAVAGGVGILAAINNFANSVQRAKYAVTDQDARSAYEGFGESTSTAGLSIFGGFKGIQAIKNNFAWAKAHPNMKVPFGDKFLKWDVSKSAVPKPPKDEKPQVEEEKPPITEETPTAETPTGGTPATEEPAGTWRPPVTEEPATGGTGAPATEPIYYNAPEISRGGYAATESRQGFFPESTPTGIKPDTGVNAIKPEASYFSETQPTGKITTNNSPKVEVQPDYTSGTAPTNAYPGTKPTTEINYTEYAPTGQVPPKVPQNPAIAEVPEGQWF